MPPSNKVSTYFQLRQNEQIAELAHFDHEDRSSQVAATTTEHSTEGNGSQYDDRSREKREDIDRQRAKPVGHFLIWRYELVCCVIFLGAFVAIVATLLPFEHKQFPQWKYGLSLNTLVSIYVVILRASVLLVASQCLSHLKWLWFRNEHKLLDFASYDEASRGPLGSLKLLWRLRFRNLLASLGAFITVAALIIDPFAQQVVSTYDCVAELENAPAKINRANSYIKEYYGGASGTVEDLPMQKAINAGVYNPGSSPPFECKTGNCTFDTPYHTVGFCSSCVDLTSQLEYSFQNVSFPVERGPDWYNASWIVSLPPNDYGAIWSASLNTQSNSIVFAMNQGRDIIAGYTSSPNSTDLIGVILPGTWSGVVGARCQLDPCIRTCTATVKNFTLQEEVISTFPLSDGALSIDEECLSSLTEAQITTLGIQQGNSTQWPFVSNVSITANGSYYHYNNSSYYNPNPDLLPNHCIYGLNMQAINALEVFLDMFLTGNVTSSGSNLWNLWGPAPMLAIYNMSWMSFESIEATFHNVSDSITTQMRIDNGRAYYEGVGVPSDPALGKTWEDRICVRVKWAFLIYPAVVVMLAMIFLIATILWHTGDVAGDWKSSQLAPLFHGLHRDPSGNLNPEKELNTVREMEGIARNMLVSLKMEGSRMYLRSPGN